MELLNFSFFRELGTICKVRAGMFTNDGAYQRLDEVNLCLKQGHHGGHAGGREAMPELSLLEGSFFCCRSSFFFP